ncbi:cerebral cavernous malformations protein 2 homolog [Lytechinus pictus]|uniref:cerebral cavernous malformations protein 2 homolog n=1 Tax=Lytechinus pictus TaxID=7653 RepID=UPI0030B9F87C
MCVHEDHGVKGYLQTGFKLFPSSKQRSSTNSNRENGSNNSASSAAAQSEPRRQLKTLELTPPDFKVDRQILIDSYLDIEVKFLGQLEDIPFEIDPTKRTEILRNIDTARKNKILPWNSHSSRYDAIIRLSARQINVLRKDETSLVRAFIHNIVSVSYVRDDAQHLVIMKTATESQQEKCELVVWECPSKEKSEEICAIVQQIFEVVYTEMTMKQFDLSLMQAVKDYSIGRSTVSHQRPPLPGLYSQPDTSSEAVPYSGANPNSNSAEIISVTAKVLLQEYIEELRSKLSGEELQQFASILKDYRQMGSIENFCTSLQRLYGPDRKTLFPGMRMCLISDHHRSFFDSYMLANDIEDPYGSRSRASIGNISDDADSTISGNSGPFTRSLLSAMGTIEPVSPTL